MSVGVARALFFSDIEGSTALLQRLGSTYIGLLLRHQDIVRSALEDFGGVEHSTEGDSFFATFPTASDAVHAAIQIQLAHQHEPWPADAGLRARIGIHIGAILDTPAGLVGLTIHHGARIAASGHGGQIVVSDVARAGCHHDVRFDDLGEHRLRDVGTVRLFQAAHDGLESVFPPLRTLPRGGKHLPAPLTALVGRDTAMNEVTQLLAANRLVSITGTGGAGKTRLALGVASERGDVYGDGVWFVDLAPVRHDDGVVPAIFDALGITSGAGDLAATIGNRSLLVLLDNCEQVITGAASAARVILEAGEATRILTTSRQPLGVPGEAVYRVPPMTLPSSDDRDAVEASEAGRLFVDRATLSKPGYRVTDSDAAGIARLCRRLDGIPLAIELVAPLVRTMPVAMIADTFGDRLLHAGSAAGRTARHRTLDDAITWSVQQLDAPLVLALSSLSVFAGSFDMEAATVAIGNAAAPEALVALSERSLVEPVGDGRFRLLEPIRQYLAHRLDGSMAADLADRHAVHFLAAVQRLCTEGGHRPVSRVVEYLDIEQDNVLAAARRLVEVRPDEGIWLANTVAARLLFADRPQATWLFSSMLTEAMVAPDPNIHARWLDHQFHLRFWELADLDISQAVQQGSALVDRATDAAVRASLSATIAFASTRPTPETVARILAVADETAPTDVLTRFACRALLWNVVEPATAVDLCRDAVAIIDTVGETELADQSRLELAHSLATIGCGDEALEIAHEAIAWAPKRVAAGRLNPETAAFAVLVESEFAALESALNSIEELHAALVSRPHHRFFDGVVDAVRARIHLLTGDATTAEALARGAIPCMPTDIGMPSGGKLARVTLAAALTARGALVEACDVLIELLDTPRALDVWFLETAATAAEAAGCRTEAADLAATAANTTAPSRLPVGPTTERRVSALADRVGDGSMLDASGVVNAVRTVARRVGGD